MMRCVFVLDLFNGAVVHAVRGEREKYEPVEQSSQIVKSSDPIQILEELNPREVYVADLNRITRSGENLDLINQISKMAKTMADIGISNLYDVKLLPLDCVPVLGTETTSLDLICEASDIREITVSIDLFKKKVLTQDAHLQVHPLELIKYLNSLAIKEIILLELDRVGTSAGLDERFLRESASLSHHDLILGGGVKDASDLDRLEKLGIKGALVATAIHNGTMPLKMIRRTSTS
ncbi:MAG: HisA/HisF-related TIM barrel protein [Methanotrichaceae archaeon]